MRTHGLLLVLALWGCGSVAERPRFVADCEEVFKDRLRSPAQYERVSVMYTKTPINFDDYKTHQVQVRDLASASDELIGAWSAIDKEVERQGGAVKHEAFIEYDAPNAYGALIRGSFQCEYVEWMDQYDPSLSSFLINGQTRSQYAAPR